jgi:hypothetical protein
MLIQTTEHTPQEIAHEAFWVAWQACDGPSGMGFLQDNPTAGKSAVIENAQVRGDYPGMLALKSAGYGELHGDYVFGRMMKLDLGWNDDGVIVPNTAPHPEYQGWMKKYGTYDALINEAISRLSKEEGSYFDIKNPVQVNGEVAEDFLADMISDECHPDNV